MSSATSALRRVQAGLTALAAEVDAAAASGVGETAAIAERSHNPALQALGARVRSIGASMTIGKTLVTDISEAMDTGIHDIDDLLEDRGQRRERPAGRAPAPGALSSPVVLPPTSARPADVHTWWLTLSTSQRESAVDDHRARLGRLDGVPCEYRDRANQLSFYPALATLEERRREFTDREGTLSRVEQTVVHRLDSLLTGMRHIKRRLEMAITPLTPRAYLLAFDAQSGRAIVSAGNPDYATHIMTHLPGTRSRLIDIGAAPPRLEKLVKPAFERRLAGLWDELVWSDDLCAELTGLVAKPAVITFANYIAPRNVQQAIRSTFARRAASRFGHFHDGLDLTHVGPLRRLVVIGHSYGSVVMGHACRDGVIHPDAVVCLGSPGTGAQHADELMVPEVWAGVEEDDFIHRTPAVIHGPQPTDSGFGARILRPVPTPARTSELDDPHLVYWHPDAGWLPQLALIGAGREPLPAA